MVSYRSLLPRQLPPRPSLGRPCRQRLRPGRQVWAPAPL